MFFSTTEAKMTCGLKVDTNDPEWYKSLSKILRKIKGASYTINAEDGMTYITGRADPNKTNKEPTQPNRNHPANRTNTNTTKKIQKTEHP
ncbi:hypothetical protein Ddye_027716 [Dipteronia dyeriana]|uniref:Uncharacterized protein n=1 Tax=Dipteronia dyeriana TaxID=168575 RepID=A0AAD9TQB2_9ROSI|nr:hypothetical protein Ddye_027716 [Dipteronia dyeriana]